jgi:hypothetical protein
MPETQHSAAALVLPGRLSPFTCGQIESVQ